MPLLRDLIHLPEHVSKSDFVMRLSEGVTKASDTVADYVVTEQLALCFDSALSLVKTAMQGGASQGTYLHGSFGSGKSHFMAVLHLLLGGDLSARAKPELAKTISKHDEWMRGKKFLLVPYHLIGADNIESAVLGGYVAHIAKLHPEASPPAVYPSQELLTNAASLREAMGDAAFFAKLNSASSPASGGGGTWGKLKSGWDAASYDAAAGQWPEHADHQRLVGDLVRTLLTSVSSAGRYVSIDNGLSAISKHAKSLGYDAVILFLDEMILWLASHAADINFLNREVPKVAKLVESGNSERPAPLVSFIARQRDLKELIGEMITGAANVNFTDILRFWQGRFGTINLEDRNLSAIAEKRLLRPKDEAARRLIDEAFAKSTQAREEMLAILLTKQGSKDDFRRLYPFSPALVETLVGVSSVLQRERTAIRIMLELLVQRRDNLELGELVAVGDLYDLIAEGDEAFSAEMKSYFEQAHKLYRTQLRPLLEEQHKIKFEEVAGLPWNDAKRKALRNDDRLIKTLLLSALAPEVESLRGLTPARLAALNHGSIQTPIPGQEGQIVLKKLRDWAGRVGQIKVQEGGGPAVISLQLSAVDIDAILERAESEDNDGSQLRLLSKALFDALEIDHKGELLEVHRFRWRGTDRTCEVRLANIRELGDDHLDNPTAEWKLLIDYPFDREGHTVHDDIAKLDDYRRRKHDQSRTLIWLPSFFSETSRRELGRLVKLEHVLSEHRFATFVTHLTDIQRAEARTIMENQRSALRSRLQHHLLAAYGLDNQVASGVLDPGQTIDPAEHFNSLRGDLNCRVPAGPTLAMALNQWLDQALASQFSAHPNFDDALNLTKGKVQKVLDVARRAAESPVGREEVEMNERVLVRQITGPLNMGTMHDTAYVQSEEWKNHFLRHEAAQNGPLTVAAMRRAINLPKPRGLPLHLQDLLILSFAAQTNRTILRYQSAVPGDLGELKDDDVLKQEVLPSAEIWESARTMAEEIFGLQQLPAMPTAAGVMSFGSKVHGYLTEKRAAASLSALQTALVPVLATFGIEGENSARMITARETAAWVRRLDKAEGSELVEMVATASFSSEPQMIARGLATCESLASYLSQTAWLTAIERARQLGGTSASSVEALVQKIADALRHDELVQSLKETLETASKNANELIYEAARGASGGGDAPVKPGPDDGRPRTIDTIDVPVPTPPLRTTRRRSQVKGDNLPDWLPKDSAPELLVEASTSNSQKVVVTPTVARLLQLDPQATLSADRRTLNLPKWNLELKLED
ncbi:MAG: phage resistance protein [Verrucomicrobiaceae bacterium]|nr:phage resistance protein [Verrucomicrobiaceae bacterium]